jgi:hypothetical protein
MMSVDEVPKKLGESLSPASRAGPAGRIAARLCTWLASPRSAWKISGIVALILAPTLWSGLVTDDVFQRMVVERKFEEPFRRFDLFNLISSDPIQRARAQELGVYPWWLGKHTQVSYWRPFAALTHVIDYTLWPHAAWLMHLENLVLYAGLILASSALYRRFIRAPWIAGLATAFYALDYAHAYPAAWIANRNAFMSTLFGVLSLLAHHRWRSERRLVFGVLGCGAFTLALLSAEAGLAIFGYTIAYTVFLDGEGPKRALSLAPYVVIIGVWRIAYRALGHGVIDSSMHLDPLINGWAFWAHAIQATPLLLASSVVAIPADPLFGHPGLTVAGAVAATFTIALFGYALGPSIRRDAATQFFAAGAVMSALPLSGSFPIDRYLFWSGLGVMGLLAQLTGGVFGARDGRSPNRVRWAVCCVCLGLRGVVSPALFPIRAATAGILEDECERLMLAVPRGPDTPNQTMVIINPPVDVFASSLALMAVAKHETIPAHTYILYAGTHDVTLSRTGSRALEARSESGWLAEDPDRAFRNVPFRLGETVDLAEMTAVVQNLTSDGRPNAVEFSFAKNLDDPELVFLAWKSDGFERVVLPPKGTMTVPAARVSVREALRPHVRKRAIEND